MQLKYFKFALGAAIAAIASLVDASYYYPTYPTGSDNASSGEAITISWIPSPDLPPNTVIPGYDLYFMTGGNLAQTKVQRVGTFPGTQTQIPFTIPQTAPGAYFFMFVPQDNSDASWTTRFSVNGGTDWYPSGVATATDPSTNSESTTKVSSGSSDEPSASTPITSDNSNTVTPTGESSDDEDDDSSSAGGSSHTSNTKGNISSGNSDDEADGSSNGGPNRSGKKDDDESTTLSITSMRHSSNAGSSSSRLARSSSASHTASDTDEDEDSESAATPSAMASVLMAACGAAILAVSAL